MNQCTGRGAATRGLVAGLAFALAGCGGGGGSGAGDYFPLSEGDVRVLRSDTGSLERTMVGTTSVVDGVASTTLRWRTLGADAVSGERHLAKTGNVVWLLPGADANALDRAIGPVPLLHLPPRVGERFEQIDRDLDTVVDLDQDGQPDRFVIRSAVQVLGFESLTVAGRAFERVAHLRTEGSEVVTLSGSGQVFNISYTLDEWYAPDIGLVKDEELMRYGQNPQARSSELVAWAIGGERSENDAPTVTASAPADGAAIGPATPLVIDFSEALEPETVGAATVRVRDAAGAPVPVVRSIVGSRLRVAPVDGWAAGRYTLTLGSGLQDLVGNALQARTLSFRVETAGAQPAFGAAAAH